jgi:polysaccharide deacetylase family protein (PEP-CTERM system associated)
MSVAQTPVVDRPPPFSDLAHAMTVDVEDWFQVQAYAQAIPRAAWDTLPRRVEENTQRLLDLLQQAGVHGTFFTLGWVAERHPALVRRIVADGHELASHGFGHARADSQTPQEFLADVSRARALLEDLGGVAVSGYRAPTFSIGPANPWAWDMLAEAGYRYSSSIYPVRHDLYGVPDAPRFPYRPRQGGIVEIPMTTLRMFGRNLPCAGGGFFRLLPYRVFRLGLRRFRAHERRGGVFYVHPWEIDPDQPDVPQASRRSRFRHRVNLEATEGRLRLLLRDFAWDRLDVVFASDLAAA